MAPQLFYKNKHLFPQRLENYQWRWSQMLIKYIGDGRKVVWQVLVPFLIGILTTEQHFSNLSMHQNHLKGLTKHRFKVTQFTIQIVFGGAQEFILLPSFRWWCYWSETTLGKPLLWRRAWQRKEWKEKPMEQKRT